MIQRVTRRRIHGLFALHGALHDGVMRLEGLDVVSITLEDLFFDSLAQTVLTDRFDNLGTVLLLGINPLHGCV
jgi:hypothetical protein